MDFRPSVRLQDARSRAETTWKGRRSPFARQRATCGSWAALTTRSRTSPKPPFQNPSIAGSACVSAVWDSGVVGGRRDAHGRAGRPRLRPAPGIGARHHSSWDRPPTFPRQIQGNRHARMGASPPTPPPADAPAAHQGVACPLPRALAPASQDRQLHRTDARAVATRGGDTIPRLHPEPPKSTVRTFPPITGTTGGGTGLGMRVIIKGRNLRTP